jgi:saccharopine dehydrogenase-like NADP-dependent oxidoreductase
MKKVLILGAGLSASSLIRYLLSHSEEHNWQIRVVDRHLDALEKKLGNHPNSVALCFNALDSIERRPEIAQADLVISMLPASFHPEVAQDCIDHHKNLITPSYVSPEMQALNNEAVRAGILIMNEIGVDPGLDHMSAMRIIDHIRSIGGEITSFKSYCGGLIAPESDNNPWNYKFTWNPRNVVLAGEGGTAQYIDRHQYKYIPYSQLFNRLDTIEVPGYGKFDGYANRDSLAYRTIYGLESIPTLYRGTLRRPGFCQHWNVLAQLGLTDDSYQMQDSANLTPRSYINTFLPFEDSISVEEKFLNFSKPYGIGSLDRYEWLGLFDDSEKIGSAQASPAQILEKILVKKLVLEPGDQDMLVMVHQFRYTLDGRECGIDSSMVNVGEDQLYTAMSNTVGLPVAICAKMILNGEIPDKGVHVPIKPHVYNPILDELIAYGISFAETNVD